MRQVPHYLIIGNGRAARHFEHYLHLLTLPCQRWDRSQPLDSLHKAATWATHILLLISDPAIDRFALTHLAAYNKIMVQFSGQLISQYAHGAHPLMTFNTALYDVDSYTAIPFVVEESAPAFSELLPGLPNAHVIIKEADKIKYHALCVLAGNFSCLLWQKLFSSFETDLKLPAEIAHPYLKQITQNLLTSPESALTGPLVRNDTDTLKKHLATLAMDPFQTVYQSFIDCYQALETRRKPNEDI